MIKFFVSIMEQTDWLNYYHLNQGNIKEILELHGPISLPILVNIRLFEVEKHINFQIN